MTPDGWRVSVRTATAELITHRMLQTTTKNSPTGFSLRNLSFCPSLENNAAVAFIAGGAVFPVATSYPSAVCPSARTHLYFRLALISVIETGAVFFMPKRTFQPNRRHRSKTHGFRTRMKTKSGRAVISRRRAKGRKRVSVKPGFRE